MSRRSEGAGGLIGTAAVAAMALLTGVGLVYGYLVLYRDAGPKFEAAHRKVWEETPSYVQGKVTHLARLRLDYKRAEDEAARATLREMIATEASTVDPASLPPDLRRFVEGIK